MDSSSDIQLYPKERLGLGAQQDSPDRYSYGRVKSYKSCVDQEDRWVIKFSLGLNLFALIKLWTHEGVMEKREWDEDEVKFCSIVRGCEHMGHGGYSRTWTYSSQERDC